MTHPNPERDERVRQIRANLDTAKVEKTRYRYYGPPTWDDVELLLSLLDSQVAEIVTLRNEVAASERYQALLLDQPDPAIVMRDLCVAKVREMKRSTTGVTEAALEDATIRRNVILGEVEIELESLTLGAGAGATMKLEEMALRRSLELVRSACSQLISLSVKESADGVQALIDLAKTDSEASKLSMTLREAESWLEALQKQ